jgi:protein SCO1/2
MKHTCFSVFNVIFFLLLFTGLTFADDIKYKRTVENYTIPDVVLVNQNGDKVHLKEYLHSDKPVIVDFIYGTCTTICPVLSAGFTNLQRKLGADSQKVQLVSITIDPEHDTPKVMKEYLKRFRAKPGWDFLTGSREDINTVMRAFDAWIPDKMSHFPLNLIREPGSSKWVRIFGLMSGSEFMAECRKVGIK